MELTRKDMESYLGKYWRYESLNLKLEPEDAENPRLGGRVEASGLVFDLRTFTPQMKKYVGVYNDEFLTFAELKDANLASSEEQLIAIVSDPVGGNVQERTTFKFNNNRLSFEKQVSGEADQEVHHAIEQTELQ